MLNNFVFYNNTVLPLKDIHLSIDNRAFRFGDGLFETIRMQDDKLLWIDDHFLRLEKGLKTLGFNNDNISRNHIISQMMDLARKNGLQTGKIRLMVFRGNGGAYCPPSDNTDYLITAEPVDNPNYQMTSRGDSIGVFPEIFKPMNSLAPIKSANGLLYVMAARYARERKLDDVILLNEKGRICECSSSNIFLVMPDGIILTPSREEGILPGVLRTNLIQLLREKGYKIKEGKVFPENLLDADEIFLTNVIKGIRWVLSFDEKRYYRKISKEIQGILSESISRKSEIIL